MDVFLTFALDLARRGMTSNQRGQPFPEGMQRARQQFLGRNIALGLALVGFTASVCTFFLSFLSLTSPLFLFLSCFLSSFLSLFLSSFLSSSSRS